MALSPGLTDRELDKFVDVSGYAAVRVAGSLTTTVSSSVGKSKVHLVRHEYVVTNVTTAAYTTLVSSTVDVINELNIFDSSGKTMVIAVGGIGSEVDQVYVFPGGNGTQSLLIPIGSRISVKAVSGNATKGELIINLTK